MVNLIVDNSKMKYYLLCFSVGLIFGCTPPEKKDCAQFKKGSFVYRSQGMQFAINRADTIQTEVDKTSGAITKTSVRWISDCSYELKLLEMSAAPNDSIAAIAKKVTVTVSIERWTDKYYTYRATVNDKGPAVIDTLWIVK